MKNSIRGFLSLALALVMCLSMGTVAFAAETTEKEVAETVATTVSTESNSDEGVMPRGNISGYAQGTITSKNNTLVVWCDSSAILNSGMGITVKATDANFDGYVTVNGYPKQGTASSFSGYQLHMGTEIYPSNLTHRGCTAYIIEFNGLTSGQEFVAKVWIYG